MICLEAENNLADWFNFVLTGICRCIRCLINHTSRATIDAKIRQRLRLEPSNALYYAVNCCDLFA